MNLASFVDRMSRVPVVGVLVRAYLKSRDDFNKDLSASIAFFSFLSIFPLVLGIVAIGSQFLDSEEVQHRIVEFLYKVLPGSGDFVTGNIEAMIRLRGAVGIASVVVLLWSARKMVGALTRGINVALGLKRNYAFFLSPLRNFGLTVTVSILLFVAMSVSPVADLLDGLDLGGLDDTARALTDLAGGRLGSIALTFLVLTCIYWLLPYERPARTPLLTGAAVASVLIELGKEVFLLYVGNVSRLEAVYGSLTSIIVLLIWLYVSARFVLFGAEVMAVCEEDRVGAAELS